LNDAKDVASFIGGRLDLKTRVVLSS
jgi:hypothetical protein